MGSDLIDRVGQERQIREIDEWVATLGQKMNYLTENIRRKILELDDAESLYEDTEAAQKIIQLVAQHVQQEVHSRIASVVSRCLGTIFEEPYEFHIEFQQKRGKTEAVLGFSRDGVILQEPLRSVGGGVIDVAAFALRLASLVLSRPHKRRVLILDEPFSKLRGETNRVRLRGLLEDLAREFGLQCVANVDSDAYPEFLLGTVVEVL